MAAPSRTRDSLRRVERDVVACTACARLRAWCTEVARRKRRAYADHDYWGRPVPGFGDARARLWIVGLAPAAHGANRTGRMFTGDASGDWLYRELHAQGFASQPTSVARNDGQRLRDVWVSAAVRCAPPDNKPRPDEIARCATYLEREFDLLRHKRVLLALGSIAFTSVLRLLAARGVTLPRPRPRFGHDVVWDVPDTRTPLKVLASYHPSRQNTQTNRLTPAMWRAVFRHARRLLDASA